LAILKHIPVRNSDYGAAQRYLLFEHDDKMKPVHDENGRMVVRTGIIQSGLNCDPFTFNTECAELNLSYGKNGRKRDVKAHHFIISFDPRDATENGLTVEKAHAIAEEYAAEMFAGHQALIVTHPDGHNKSGNIHCHIVINSVRKLNRIYKPFMERPTDTLAGYKHHQTPALLKAEEEELNKLCEREHLHTMDFSVPADRRITDREYHAKNSQPSFETVKEQLRKAIDDAIAHSRNITQFTRFLQSGYGISLKETRGVWSFVMPGREKPMHARSLGRLYEKQTVTDRINGISFEDSSRPEYRNLPRIFLIHSDLKLVVDIQNCIKAQQSRAYARKVAISNLQQIASSVAYIQRSGIATRSELNAVCESVENSYRKAISEMRAVSTRLKAVNEQIHYLGQFLSTRDTYSQFLSSADKTIFRKQHESEISLYEEARKNLRDIYPSGTFPVMKDLKSEKAKLLKQLSTMKEEYQTSSRQRNILRIAKANVDSILGVETRKAVRNSVSL